MIASTVGVEKFGFLFFFLSVLVSQLQSVCGSFLWEKRLISIVLLWLRLKGCQKSEASFHQFISFAFSRVADGGEAFFLCLLKPSSKRFGGFSF